MARRKRKDDVPVWEPPEFDEVGYMRKEIENAKISIVVIAWAIVGAILFYLFYAYQLAVVGFLLGLLVFGALYFLLPLLGLPIHGFKRKDWASHAMVYFFSWLAFTILLLNPPFGDHTYPVVGSFQVGTFNGSGSNPTPANNSVFCYGGDPGSTVRAPPGGNSTVYVIFRATDDVAVGNVTASYNLGPLSVIPVSGQPNACKGAPNPTYYPDTYVLSFPLGLGGTGPYTVTVTATDTSGLRTVASIEVVTS